MKKNNEICFGEINSSSKTKKSIFIRQHVHKFDLKNKNRETQK